MNEYKPIRPLKEAARAQLIGRYGIAIPAILMIAAIQFITMLLSDSGSTGSVGSYLLKYAISLIIDLLMGILIFGKSLFFLKMARCRTDATVKDIFFGFKNNGDKAVLVQLPFTFISFLCSLPMVLINLGIIPCPTAKYFHAVLIFLGIQIVALFVARLFLGLSFYILADRPNLSVPEILSESIRLMTNKKGRLFLICLSVLPFMILGALGLIFGLLWVEAFYQTLLADFYLETVGETLGDPVKSQNPGDGCST